MALVPAVRRRRVAAAWLLALLVPLLLTTSGCGVLEGPRRGHVVLAATPAPTTGPDAFERSGRGAHIRVTLPPSDAPKPYPLLVALHSLYYDGTDPEQHWDLDGLARTAGLAVVYPDGLNRAWNAGTCCEPAVTNHTDDVGWLRALIAHLSERYPIDRNRVSLIGLSNGGMLAYRYACEHGDELAGIAVVAASRQVSDCHPGAPLTVVDVHGGADGHIPYQGTPWSPVLRTAITSVEESMIPFRSVDRCPVPSRPTDTVLTDSAGVPWHAPVASPSALSVGTDADVAAPVAVPPVHPASAPVNPASAPVNAAPRVLMPSAVPGVPANSTAVTSPAVALRKETPCASSARVVQFLLPALAHGWPAVSGPAAFATGRVIWNLLAPARSARPGPRM